MQPNQNAILTSPQMTFDPYRNCRITFAYHMYGATVGSLKIYVEPQGRGKTVAWSKSGEQGIRWFVDYIEVPSSLNGATRFVITFEATSGSSWTGDISLDDLILGPCGTSLFIDLLNGSRICLKYLSVRLHNGLSHYRSADYSVALPFVSYWSTSHGLQFRQRRHVLVGERQWPAVDLSAAKRCNAKP